MFSLLILSFYSVPNTMKRHPLAFQRAPLAWGEYRQRESIVQAALYDTSATASLKSPLLSALHGERGFLFNQTYLLKSCL